MRSTLGTSTDTCITLAKTAIKKLLEKLNPNDRFCLSTFNDTFKTIFHLDYISNKSKLIQKIDKIEAEGGNGFTKCIEAGVEIMKKDLRNNTEKRILFLTDMQWDDPNLYKSISEAAKESIFTTFIGIGLGFNVDVADKVISNKGCSYDCALNEEHLNKIYDRFEYDFFPIAFDVKLEYMSDDFETVKCIGAQDKNISHLKEKNSDWKTGTHANSEKYFQKYVNFLLLAYSRLKKNINLFLQECVIL